jgi:hypothetical protein
MIQAAAHTPSWPDLFRPSTSLPHQENKTRMPGTRFTLGPAEGRTRVPGMTSEGLK